MKFKVSYYDFETDKHLTKDCNWIQFKDGNFLFGPVDNPVKIIKNQCQLTDSKVTFYRLPGDRMKIIVAGYQCLRDGSYCRTETLIENVRED